MLLKMHSLINASTNYIKKQISKALDKCYWKYTIALNEFYKNYTKELDECH